MKEWWAKLFLVLYGVALMRPISPLIEYYANQDYFAEVLCINRNKPELHCNGQCILMQKLKKASGEATDQPTSPVSERVNLKDYPIGFISSISVSQSISRTRMIQATPVDEGLPTSPLFEIFHPPKIS